MSKYHALQKICLFPFLVLLLNLQLFSSQVVETTQLLLIDHSKSTIRTRFTPPKGYVWEKDLPGSFSEFMSSFPLHPRGFPVRDFNAVPIEKQTNHIAVLKIDVGDKDLQQCADAWIRFYAEYLWGNKRFEEICFEFTSGQFFSWNDYKNGVRTREVRRKVSFYKTKIVDDSYQNFRTYLNLIFRYAGTISLNKESYSLTDNSQIQAGDFIIKPGSPGHSVIIVGAARNNAGKRLFLLAESFMPAQDIHVLVNRQYPKISPWYELDINSPKTVTAKYTFEPTSIKRFHTLK
ncbi:DUF4846 domain-containing protein [Chryseobacterium sp. MP_3.2]|uniref:DUF4846 domain-containing protein n=1 Tax=Chryseobacterium sp. MP_3.2 TaxID=3071712 RepID=UPI002E06BBD3|nr:hypothetical protein [Chryseobacterium sp. MP_3.2]